MVPEFYPPVLGGVAQHVISLTESLKKKGHDVKVLTLGWKGLNQHEDNTGFEIIRTPGFFQKLEFIYGNKNYRFHPPISDPIFSKKIYTFMELFKPDVIHCHGWTIYSALKIKKNFNIPLILTLHDYGLMCPARTMYNDKNNICTEALTSKCLSCAEKKVGTSKARIMCWALKHNKNNLRLVDKYIAVSTPVKNIHCKYLDGNKIEVIYNFYNADTDQKNINNIYLPDDFIMFAGALKLEKGVDVLVNAYRKLNTNAKLVIFGMKRPGFNMHTDNNVIILENQPHNIVMEAWRKCLFGVVPSVWAEPFGIVALEAMSCGKAIIGSDIGGLQDIVLNGETGLLVPPGDVESLSLAMNKLLTQPEMAKALGKKGHERLCEQFAIDKVVSKIERLYKEAAGN
jgi:glycosyltransferase involved in cell wall biosynthesis